MEVPTIENIHAKVYEACNKPGALDMSTWHTSCGTTHCRAGWVVHLAGDKGYALEKQTSTEFAAMQIYKKSSPTIQVMPPRFYEGNTVAMENMRACAESEAKL